MVGRRPNLGPDLPTDLQTLRRNNGKKAADATTWDAALSRAGFKAKAATAETTRPAPLKLDLKDERLASLVRLQPKQVPKPNPLVGPLG